jgi:hypothetical protein
MVLKTIRKIRQYVPPKPWCLYKKHSIPEDRNLVTYSHENRQCQARQLITL